MGTLLRPAPNDPTFSPIENCLELLRLNEIDSDMFTNKRILYAPTGARGVYGGGVIAQCLAAAQATVPEDFLIHSMHCYFVLAGNPDIPIIYHVEHVREGKSFATRTVQARQRAKAIFTTTLSFQREGSEGAQTIDHEISIPNAPAPTDEPAEAFWIGHGPFETQHHDSWTGDPTTPYEVRASSWMRARGRISDLGGYQAHTVALAYMTDSYFIGTISRAHRMFRDVSKQTDASASHVRRFKYYNGGEEKNVNKRPEIGMMVSLDHTIYFHRPKEFRADEWLYTEMQTPWAGAGRGVVQSRIWTQDGRLVASCFQEGLVRLKQDPDSKL